MVQASHASSWIEMKTTHPRYRCVICARSIEVDRGGNIREKDQKAFLETVSEPSV